MPQVAPRGFGDVDREVADALEIRVDLDRRHDRAKVDRHRLVQREQLEAAVVDLDVELIDRLIPREDAVHARGVALDERPHRRADAILGEAAHLEQPRLELGELLLEMGNGGCRHDLVVTSRSKDLRYAAVAQPFRAARDLVSRTGPSRSPRSASRAGS